MSEKWAEDGDGDAEWNGRQDRLLRRKSLRKRRMAEAFALLFFRGFICTQRPMD